MAGRIVIVDDEPITRIDIRDILERENYEVVGEAFNGIEAIELCKMYKPDLVIMDIRMPLLDGIKASKLILAEKLGKAIVLLSAYSDRDHIEKAKQSGVHGYLVKPVTEKTLLPMVEIAIATGAKAQKYEHSVEKLAQKLSERKIIERAKGLLMEEQNMSENDAYNLLRRLSMDHRRPVVKIAEMFLVGCHE